MKKLIHTLLLLNITLFCLAQTPVAETPDHLVGHNELEPKIDALVAKYIDLDIFSGVILMADKGEPFYHKAFGMADRAHAIPNHLNTKFDIGSMNKSFTKVIILQLVAEGKIRMDDRLGQYLDGFSPEASGDISIRDLMEHRSGFGDYHSPDFFDAPASDKTIAGLLPRLRNLPLMFPPGADQLYSNSGYILLGAIIEKATAKSYYQNVMERIIKPLELRETYIENKNEVPDRAIGYYKNARGRIFDNEGFLEVPNPDGGFQSTCPDILKFYLEYYYGNTILSDEMRVQNEEFSNERKASNGVWVRSNAGGFNGANTVFFDLPERNIQLLIFANMDEPVAEQLGLGILDLYWGKEAVEPSLPARQNIYKAFKEKGPDYVLEHFDQLSSNFHPSDPKDLILNELGYDFLFAGEADSAILFFKLNTVLFPKVPNVWDSLGEASLAIGDKEGAIRYYKKALELDPAFPSALKAIRELGSME